jgi:YHS domain-containing protein
MKHLLTAGLIAMALGACSSERENYSRSTHTWATSHGTFAEDPVSHNPVDVTKAVVRNYLGETYYFENSDNAREFDARPTAYLYDDNSPERSSSPGTQGVR